MTHHPRNREKEKRIILGENREMNTTMAHFAWFCDLPDNDSALPQIIASGKDRESNLSVRTVPLQLTAFPPVYEISRYIMIRAKVKGKDPSYATCHSHQSL
ncbi:MAG TPA: hypothetical protein VEP90_30450 [Methylomirabilota bacterium]|nr:hypothetical protein [Methylomirabilota bacterium]